jgi:hypothetical protein
VKPREILRVSVIAALLPLLSGCFTQVVSREAIGSKSDWFSPSALYKSKTDGSLAVEGTLTKAGEQKGQLAYLIIPQKVLVVAHLQTKGNVTFEDVRSLSPQVRQEMYLRKELSSDYEKITNIANKAGMDVNQRTTVNIGQAGLLPFAFVFDVVTFPLEIYFGKKIGEGLSNLQ